MDQGKTDAAVSSFREALALQADSMPALLSLGSALLARGGYAEAAAQFEQALALAPEHAAARANLSLALQGLGRFSEALTQLQRAAALAPGDAVIQGNLGNLLKSLGHSAGAVAHYRLAVDLQPDDLAARGALLFALNYTAEPSLDEARRYGKLAAVAEALPFDTPRAGRLRLGLVSPDLRAHPVGFFAESALAALAPHLDLFVYANAATHDDVTARIRAHCQGWAMVRDWTDEALAARIRADGIDVLLDLSGHTAGNRLPLFARRAAAVQASWLGYCATTGVEAMDCFIGDPWVTPETSQAQFSERLLRLPETFLCFTPPTLDLSVGPLPALTQGHLSFGCFNSPAKLNDKVLALWTRVLNAVPNSRLLLKAMPYASPDVQGDLRHRFARLGLSADRLTFEAGSARDEYLAAYQQIDIALDPFPYPGGTTTVEGLWMGVPVLTLAGDKALARQGVSILQNVGLPDWIANDEDDYLARAVRHASDLTALALLRGQLRPRLLASPLCDAPRFAAHFAALLKSVVAGRHGLQP
jgi:predicted O-linked N-acetylglucosamine transferase (SPINDLY family)